MFQVDQILLVNYHNKTPSNKPTNKLINLVLMGYSTLFKRGLIIVLPMSQKLYGGLMKSLKSWECPICGLLEYEFDIEWNKKSLNIKYMCRNCDFEAEAYLDISDFLYDPSESYSIED